MNTNFDYSKHIPENPRMGRRLVIADIHGFARTFRTLVEEKLQLTLFDQLFLLGDYIDRGPDSAGVIDFILELQAAEYQVFALRGNHEENFLDAYKGYQTGIYQKFFLQMIAAEKLDKLLDSKRQLLPVYQGFFDSLPYYFELDRFYLVHAGFRFTDPHPFKDFDSMTTMRRFVHNPTDKTIIHGHDITDLLIIKQKIAERSNIIPLDNGCYYGPALKSGTPGYYTGMLQQNVGKLLALDLDTFELWEQENVD